LEGLAFLISAMSAGSPAAILAFGHLDGRERLPCCRVGDLLELVGDDVFQDVGHCRKSTPPPARMPQRMPAMLELALLAQRGRSRLAAALRHVQSQTA